MAPLSLQHALDPFTVKLYSKAAPWRLIWTAQSRLLQMLARVTYRSSPLPFGRGSHFTLDERGEDLPDSAVSVGQIDLLVRALAFVEQMEGDIAEVGVYKGATTVALALQTSKMVYAVDPFIGYGAGAYELQQFRRRTIAQHNVIHIIETSGVGSRQFQPSSLSFIFIDAVHDVSNTWFDFATWSAKLRPGGLLALHDVDDHQGVRFVAKKFLREERYYSAWGYCPNLLILQKS